MYEKHGEEIRIYNHYTNSKERLHIKTLCDLFNDMAEVHTKQLGVDVATLNKKGQTWMLRQIHIRLIDMPKKEERVWFETWASGIHGLFINRDYRVLSKRKEKNGMVMRDVMRAYAHTEWMVIDIARRRPERPMELLKVQAEWCKEKIEDMPSLFTRLEAKGDFSGLQGEWSDPCFCKANFDDIDFNGHVTQSSYVQWLMDGLSFGFMRGHELIEIEVVYENEIQPESAVKVFCLEQASSLAGQCVITHLVKDKTEKILHSFGRSVWREIGGAEPPGWKL
ncbi:MAG: thioesterase [Bacteroidales bacterium]